MAEEVARIVGYDALPTTNLRGEMPPAIAQPLRDLRERARDLLAAAGMQEVINYSLTTIEALQQVVAPDVLATQPPLRAVNPLSSDHEYLRTSLRASVLQTLAANLRYAEGEVALFEAARVYLPRGTELPLEEEQVSGVVGGYHVDRWGHPTSEAVDFYDAKGYVEALLQGMGIEAAFVEAEVFAMLPGRSAEVRVKGQTVGVVGQVHPRVAAAFDVEGDAYLFEVVLDRLLPLIGGPRRYEAVSRFPSVVQDIALLVDEDVTAGRIEEIDQEGAAGARGAPVRLLHGRAGGRRQEVAGLLDNVPVAGAHADGRGGGAGAARHRGAAEARGGRDAARLGRICGSRQHPRLKAGVSFCRCGRRARRPTHETKGSGGGEGALGGGDAAQTLCYSACSVSRRRRSRAAARRRRTATVAAAMTKASSRIPRTLGRKR